MAITCYPFFIENRLYIYNMQLASDSLSPALAGSFFITSTSWEAQEKNELLINLTPWKDLKTGCAKKAEHRTGHTVRSGYMKS